jgi:hypothetical protein
MRKGLFVIKPTGKRSLDDRIKTHHIETDSDTLFMPPYSLTSSCTAP